MTGLGMRARVAVAATRGVNAVSRRLGAGSGTVIGGRAGLAVDPGLLARLAADRRLALVSGTNGKTTTTRLLAVALEAGAREPGVRAAASGGGHGRRGGARRKPGDDDWSGPGGARGARGRQVAVVTNATGSNMPAGHVAALAAGPPGAPAVLEVDEGYLPGLVRTLRPAAVVLLNLSRDQLDRTNEVRMLAGRWREALANAGETTVVANADDPLVAWGAGAAPRVVWVGAGLGWQLDAVGCPACEGRIEFGGAAAPAGLADGPGRSRENVAAAAGPARGGGTAEAGASGSSTGGPGASGGADGLDGGPAEAGDSAGRSRGNVVAGEGAGGGWSCACGFARPAVDVDVVDRAPAGGEPAGTAAMPGDGTASGEATTGGGTEAVWAGGRRAEVALRIPGRFNRGNAVMAAAAAEALGVPADRALGAMAAVGEVGGRFTVRRIRGVPTRLLLAKNPAGWHELLELVCPGRSPVVVGINARVADGRDPSWLWDVPFEMLQGRPVVATGERCLDLAVRLRYAEVPHRTVRDPRAAVALAGSALAPGAVPSAAEAGTGAPADVAAPGAAATDVGSAGAAVVEFIGNYTAFFDLLEDR